MSKIKTYGLSLSFFVALLVAVELIVKVLAIPTWLLPAPSVVIIELITNFPALIPHIVATMKLATIGLISGVAVGFFIGVTLHLMPFVHQLLYPFILVSQNIPTIVLAPLLIIWFGFGLLPKVVIISIVCFFPIAIAMLDGLRQTTPELKHYFLMAGANRQQLFWKLELPFAMPSLFSGLKIAATYSVMGAVVTEWLGAKEGLGVYMTYAQSAFRTDRVFVAITCIVTLSLLFFAVIRLLEEKIVHRHDKGGQQDAKHSSAR